MLLRRLVPPAVAVLVALVVAPAAGATTETDAQGQVTASLSYTKNRDGFTYSGVGVRIERGGALLFSGPIRNQGPGGFRGSKAVDAVDLDGDGEPEVVLNLFSGGAHCCVSAWVYRYRPATNGYVKTEQFFGDLGFKLRNLGGSAQPEFLSGDPFFSGAFTSYAESSFPVQILRFAGGRFTNVTAKFPARVRADLADRQRFYRSVRHRKGNARGALAAIAADQYTLGDAKAARATVAKGKKLYGAGFARSLGRFLARHGYAR